VFCYGARILWPKNVTIIEKSQIIVHILVQLAPVKKVAETKKGGE